jgi:hypothetical protein
MPVSAVIDEAGFERGFDARDNRFVNIAFALFLVIRTDNSGNAGQGIRRRV